MLYFREYLEGVSPLNSSEINTDLYVVKVVIVSLVCNKIKGPSKRTWFIFILFAKDKFLSLILTEHNIPL